MGNLAAIGIPESAFDAVISADDVHRKKPDPETFLVAAAAVGVEPRATVLGITSSQSAESLLGAGAAATAPDFTALPTEILLALGLVPG